MSTKPPVVARWLLTRLVGGPDREALLGDLVEQHASGKSNAWFRRETLAAIGASFAAEARAHSGGAGWLVCRVGEPVSALAFAAFVGVRELPLLYEPIMSILDHFGGLWLITHHGMTALPASWPWAAACIAAGAICGARPRGGESTPFAAAQ